MSRPLSRRRQLEEDVNWSENVDDFLGLSHPEKKRPKTQQQPKFPNLHYTKSSNEPKRSGYIGARNAFLSKQRQQETLVKKYQSSLEKSDNFLKKTKVPRCIQKRREFTSAPVRQIDDHVLERVITERNEEYYYTTRNVPKGYIVDLKTFRELPRDRQFFGKGTPRVFFWG